MKNTVISATIVIIVLAVFFFYRLVDISCKPDTGNMMIAESLLLEGCRYAVHPHP